MKRLVAIALLIPACRETPSRALDAAPDPTPVVDAAAEVERGPDISDALAQLEAIEEAGVDAAAPAQAKVSVTKVTPKGALDPVPALTRDRFRFRSCGKWLSDAGAKSKVALTIKVGEGGEVVSVIASDKSPLGECVRDAAAHVKFDEPSGGSAAIEVQVDLG